MFTYGNEFYIFLIRSPMLLNTQDIFMRALKITARIMSALAVAWILIVFFAGGMREGFTLQDIPPYEILLFLAFAMILLGHLLAWKWELFGGLLAVSGLITFYLIYLLLTGLLPGGALYIILTSPAILFIIYGFLDMRHRMHIKALKEDLDSEWQ